MQGDNADDELRGIAEGRVDQPSNYGPQPMSQPLGRTTHQFDQRHNRQQRRGEHQQGLCLKKSQREGDRNHQQQPTHHHGAAAYKT